MFAVQCQCGVTNDAEAKRCTVCGEDLTPPTASSEATSSLVRAFTFFALGVAWFFIVRAQANLTSRSTSHKGEVFYLIWTYFGTSGAWASAVVFWSLGALELRRARRLRLEARSDDAPVSPVAAPELADASGPSPRGSARGLYRSLAVFVGLAAVAGVLVAIAVIAPVLPPDSFATQIAYGSSAIAALAVVAGVVSKARIPRRGAGTSIDDFWSRTEVTSAATLTWFLLEGAVLVAGVSYWLPADRLVAVALCAAIVAFLWASPGLCARQRRERTGAPA